MIWCWWSGSPTPRSCTRPIRTTQDWIWTGLNLPLLFPLALSFLIHPLLARIVSAYKLVCTCINASTTPPSIFFTFVHFSCICVCAFFSIRLLMSSFFPAVVFIALFGLDVNILFVLLVCLFAFLPMLKIESAGRALARDWMKQWEWVGSPARKFTGLYLVPFSSLFITPLLCFIFR